MKSFFPGLFFGILLALSGCGYMLQNSRSPLRDVEDVHSVYVNPFINNTYKPGAENVVYNSVIRALSAGRRIRVVYNKDDADAELYGQVNGAELYAYSDTSVFSLSPANLGTPFGKSVTSTYEGTLSCSFALFRLLNPTKKQTKIWGSSFSRKKPFATAARLGAQGTTTGLINESEYDRAISELSDRIADDMHESMMALF